MNVRTAARFFSLSARAPLALLALLACDLPQAQAQAPAPSLAGLGLAYATGWAHDENSGDGYAYFRSKTLVDCAHTRVGYHQSADIYTGAYTHGPDGRVIVFADIGVLLQNDALQPGELGVPDKVQLYGEAATTAQSGLLRYAGDASAPQNRYYVKCDTPLQITFFVNGANAIDARYEGTFVEKRGGRIFRGSLATRIAGFVAADGWTTACANCAVRRDTSLAVRGGAPERPGSYYGISDTTAGRVPEGSWTGSIEGRYTGGEAGEPASYDLKPFAAAQRDIVDSPANAKRYPLRRPAFLVVGEGGPAERIALDERTAAPAR